MFEEAERKGTADAVLTAREALAQHKGDVVVLYADTPLLTTSRCGGDRGASIRAPASPCSGSRRPIRLDTGLLTDPGGWLMAIREDRDASESETPRPSLQLGRLGLPP